MWRNGAFYLVVSVLLSAQQGGAFLARPPVIDVGGRAVNRLSATLVREHSTAGGRRPELQPRQQASESSSNLGGLGGPQLTGRQEVDVEVSVPGLDHAGACPSPRS